MAAAARIEGVGGVVRLEIEVERYGFVPQHPLRGLQTCERLSILDGDLILTRGRLAEPPEIRTLLHHAPFDQLLAGLQRERKRWAAKGMVEVEDEIELLQRVSPREPRLEAALCESNDRDFFDHARVYGDWLQDQGDPRGLLAMHSLPIESTSELNRVISEHASHLLGSLWLELPADALRWLGPVVIGATLGSSPPPPREDELPEIISWCESRAAPPIISMIVDRRADPPPDLEHADELRVLAKLLALPVSVTLRWIVLERSFARHPQLFSTLAAARCATSLRAITVDGAHDLHVSKASFERLEQLSLTVSGRLALDIRLPALRWLSVSLANPLDWVAGFVGLDAPALEHVRMELWIPNAQWRNRLEELLSLPSFSRLRSLGLRSRGDTSYDGLDYVLAGIPALATLERIDLRGARFCDDTCTRLVQRFDSTIELQLPEMD